MLEKILFFSGKVQLMIVRLSVADQAACLRHTMAKRKLPRISCAITILLSILRHPAFYLFIFLLGLLAFILTIHFLSPMAEIIHRRPLGLETTWDLPTPDLYFVCRASDPASWGYGACSGLINCYLNKLSELHKADTAIGSTLATLLPTIMVLISTELNDLVPQALVSPHRALATALFTVGAPAVMLRQLKPVQRGRLQGDRTRDGHERTWDIPIACITSKESHRHIAVKLVADMGILALAATMFYQAWLVNVSTVVPWKCECPLLIFIWPLLCILWLGFSVLVLLAMTEEIEFQNVWLKDRPTWLRTFLLPYAVGRASKVDQDYCIKITARMPRDGRISWIANWRIYDLLTGAAAAAVYLYATFILSGSLFLGAVSAARFTSIVSTLYVVVRVIGGVA